MNFGTGFAAGDGGRQPVDGIRKSALPEMQEAEAAKRRGLPGIAFQRRQERLFRVVGSRTAVVKEAEIRPGLRLRGVPLEGLPHAFHRVVGSPDGVQDGAEIVPQAGVLRRQGRRRHEHVHGCVADAAFAQMQADEAKRLCGRGGLREQRFELRIVAAPAIQAGFDIGGGGKGEIHVESSSLPTPSPACAWRAQSRIGADAPPPFG